MTKMKTKTKIYKNHSQRGHYYVIDNSRQEAVEIVQGSEVHVRKVDWKWTSEELMNNEGIPGWCYDFRESNFLDILVVTGVSKAKIYDVMANGPWSGTVTTI